MTPLPASTRDEIMAIRARYDQGLTILGPVRRDLAAPMREVDRFEKICRGRQRLLDRILGRHDRNDPIGDPDLRRLRTIQNLARLHSVDTAQARAERLRGQLEELAGRVSRSGLPYRDEVLNLLRRRGAQAAVAFAKQVVGEPLSPSEEVLLGDLTGSLEDTAEGNRDSLIEGLKNHLPRQPLVSLPQDLAEKMRRVLDEEALREVVRQRVMDLPGAGRGTINPIDENAKDAARVMMDSALEVIGGPKSLPRVPWTILVFLAGAAYATCGAIGDLITGERWHLFNKTIRSVGLSIMGAVRWRPELSADSVRAIEEALIASKMKRRAVVVGVADHLSYMDIPPLFTLMPETRFGYKSTLWALFPILPILKLTHMSPIDRESPKKSREQIQEAGNRMRRYGVWMAMFVPGTRSYIGGMGEAKQGTGHLVAGTDAVVLEGSVLGTDGILAPGLRVFRDGVGTHRIIPMRFNLADSREIISPDPQAPAPYRQVTRHGKETGTSQYFEALDKLKQMAAGGNKMAKAQLAELSRKTAWSRSAVSNLQKWALENGSAVEEIEEETDKWERAGSKGVPPSEGVRLCHLAKEVATKNRTDYFFLKALEDYLKEI